MKWLELSELVIILAFISNSVPKICKHRPHMDGYVVAGVPAAITKFSHSALLRASCVNSNKSSWICGSSILNQRILLTAAHCIVADCEEMFLTVYVGNENKFKGHKVAAIDTVIHENYDAAESSNDIGLVLLEEPLVLDQFASRVVLFKNPPTPIDKLAFIAGWGITNETTHNSSSVLMKTSQTVMTREECSEILGWIPHGCICGTNQESSVAGGDSGSALVVSQYIQIGIVSHKYPLEAERVIVYTDTAYFYDWIQQEARKLYCQN